jgi:surface antigen
MNLGRLFAIHIALCLSSAFAPAARAETPYEAAVQYALEYLTSGISTASMFRGTEVTVRPVRTWKSVSGHYCRKYEITVTEPGTGPVHGEKTRCRVEGGWWKLVNND